MRRVVFAAAAFRHGFREEDFFELLARRYLKIRSQRGVRDVYELLGRTLAGDYVHVVYRVLPRQGIRVFHMNRMTEKQKRRYQRSFR